MKSICYRTNLKLANKILDRPSAVIVVVAVSMSKPKESMSIDSSLVDVQTDALLFVFIRRGHSANFPLNE